ncbi:MAG: hypothetical protein DCC67_05995 [Planctomycetota bacterium]|nr:MAG: hypothetical protein DCC67_05995 [Planctomycetota bacterium]
MVLVIRLEGRIWFCKCGELLFVVADAWSPHTSQHLFDPYSLSHVQHGLIFYGALRWLWPRATWQTRLVIATALEAGWEILENSPPVINRYREATAALGYEGDSVVNALGDLLSCVLGFALASKLGLRGSVAVLLAIEVGMLVRIRDSLLLNILMLFYPLDAVRHWQMAT